MTNKTKIIFLGLTLLFLMAFGGSLFKAYAADEEEILLPEEYGDFLSSLPDGISDKLPENVFKEDRESVFSAAEDIMSVTFILNAVLGTFTGSLTALFPTLALLLGIVILSALCHIFASGFGGLSQAVGFASRLCSYCAIATVAVSTLSILKEYFDSLFAVVAAFLPLSGVLYAMGGNFTSAAAGSATLTATLAICQFFFSKTVIPVFCTCLSLSLLTVFDGVGAGAARSVSGILKKWYTTALAFIMMILTTVLAGQSILAAKADNAAMRGARFAASSFIPVAGGTVSSTLGTLAASIELMRSSVGIIGIAVILLSVCSVVVRLAAMRVILAISSFTAGMLGCTGEQRLLDEVGSLYGYLEGIAAISAAVFIIAMAVFASTASAVSVGTV